MDQCDQSKAAFSGSRPTARLPADLGFYDLRVPEARAAQQNSRGEPASRAFVTGITGSQGSASWKGRSQKVLQSGEPDFPFCLGWANQTWTGIWHGAPKRVLMEQTYPGPGDHERHFHALLPAFFAALHPARMKSPSC